MSSLGRLSTSGGSDLAHLSTEAPESRRHNANGNDRRGTTDPSGSEQSGAFPGEAGDSLGAPLERGAAFPGEDAPETSASSSQYPNGSASAQLRHLGDILGRDIPVGGHYAKFGLDTAAGAADAHRRHIESASTNAADDQSETFSPLE